MKIEKLIEIFEQCIPTYQKCVDENWDFRKIEKEDLESGICRFCNLKLDCSVYNVFETYYKYYSSYGDYIFRPAYLVKDIFIYVSIIPRLKFLKQQVKELKKLQKQGYTHV